MSYSPWLQSVDLPADLKQLLSTNGVSSLQILKRINAKNQLGRITGGNIGFESSLEMLLEEEEAAASSPPPQQQQQQGGGGGGQNTNFNNVNMKGGLATGIGAGASVDMSNKEETNYNKNTNISMDGNVKIGGAFIAGSGGNGQNIYAPTSNVNTYGANAPRQQQGGGGGGSNPFENDFFKKSGAGGAFSNPMFAGMFGNKNQNQGAAPQQQQQQQQGASSHQQQGIPQQQKGPGNTFVMDGTHAKSSVVTGVQTGGHNTTVVQNSDIDGALIAGVSGKGNNIQCGVHGSPHNNNSSSSSSRPRNNNNNQQQNDFMDQFVGQTIQQQQGGNNDNLVAKNVQSAQILNAIGKEGGNAVTYIKDSTVDGMVAAGIGKGTNITANNIST